MEGWRKTRSRHQRGRKLNPDRHFRTNETLNICCRLGRINSGPSRITSNYHRDRLLPIFCSRNFGYTEIMRTLSSSYPIDRRPQSALHGIGGFLLASRRVDRVAHMIPKHLPCIDMCVFAPYRNQVLASKQPRFCNKSERSNSQAVKVG